MHYYQFNIADYRKNTSHLSLLEHGIYRQLLDSYYLNEKPLCIDHAELMRSHCVRTPEEKEAFKQILKDFFTETKKGFIHKKVEENLNNYREKSEKAKKSANARWAKVSCDANALPTHSERNANGMLTNNHKPITNNQLKACVLIPNELVTENAEVKKITQKTPASLDLEKWDMFWAAYPRGTNKAKAKDVFLKLNPDEVLFKKIIAALQNQAKTWSQGYEPHATTWLNGKRWDDEIKSSPSKTALSQNAYPPVASVAVKQELSDFAKKQHSEFLAKQGAAI